jgi:hypothetical protein
MKRLRGAALILAVLGCAPAVSGGVRGSPADRPPDDFIGLDAQERLPSVLADAASGINATSLRTHIAWLADPARAGRGLGTPGLAATAEYVAGILAAAGVAPLRPADAADPAAPYFQTVPLRRVTGPGGELTITLPATGAPAVQTWRAGVSCVTPAIAPQDITGPLVFAGWGIREPDLGHDDFAGLDVRDKIVVFVGGVPPGALWQRPDLVDRYAARRPQDRYDVRLALLAELGARAAIAIEEGLAARLTAGQESREPYFVPAANAPARREPPLVRVTPDLGALLFARVGFDPLQPSRYRAAGVAGATVAIRIIGRVEPALSGNVIGVLAGSDPNLRQEAVIIGAHLDHLGRIGGALHPGADDNASGVAALLEMARAFAASPQRPRRTVVFAFWTAEEAGQFGSEHYVHRPLWPLAQTSVYVNLDTIAHPWSSEQIRDLVGAAAPANAAAILAGTTSANFAEPGFAATAPWLGDALAAAGRGTGMTLHLDRTDGRNGGSDYRAFAQAGLPWIRFFGNFFPAYHEPGDTLDNLDPSQVERMGRLAFATTWLLADR